MDARLDRVEEPLDGRALARRLADVAGRPLVIAPRCLDLGPTERASVPPAHRSSPDSQRRVDRTVAVARALRSDREPVRLAQQRFRDAGADVLVAPTATTSDAALEEIGFAYRAAALTAEAIEQTRAALATGARSPCAVVAEIVVHEGIDATRGFAQHIERIAHAGVAGLYLTRPIAGARVSAPRWASAIAAAHAHGLVSLCADEIDDADTLVALAHLRCADACVIGVFGPSTLARSIEAGGRWLRAVSARAPARSSGLAADVRAVFLRE